jgi:DNA-binding MarR family transcriptional regulator
MPPSSRARATKSRRPATPSAPAAAADPVRAQRISATLDCFRRVIRALRVAARYAEERSGLRPAQLFVLSQIAAAPNQSLSEIADRTMTDRTSVASMVGRLASRGLVRRVRGADDKRRVEIEVTSAGASTLRRAPSSPTQFLLDGLERLDDATLDRLARDVGALVRAIGASETPATMLFEDERRDGAHARRPAAAVRRRR